MCFTLDTKNATLYNSKQARALEAAFAQILDETVEVVIDVGDVGEGTPARRVQLLAQARQEEAERAIADDAVLAGVLSEFDGEIIEGSIRPLH